jgi:hypothetical protein
MTKSKYSSLWDEFLTPEQIKYVEDRFGLLVNSLAELATLVRKVGCQPMKAKQSPIQEGHSYIDATECQIEIKKDYFLAVPAETYPLVIRALTSAKRLRLLIEMVQGKQQAKKFYYELASALVLGKDVSTLDGSINYFDPKRKIEEVAQTLEDCDRKILLLLSNSSGRASKKPAIKPPTKRAIEARHLVLAMGYTETEAAQKITKVHKKKVSQPTIHRDLDRCEKWLIANGLPADAPLSQTDIAIIDPELLDMGKRTDAREAAGRDSKRADIDK